MASAVFSGAAQTALRPVVAAPSQSPDAAATATGTAVPALEAAAVASGAAVSALRAVLTAPGAVASALASALAPGSPKLKTDAEVDSNKASHSLDFAGTA